MSPRSDDDLAERLARIDESIAGPSHGDRSKAEDSSAGSVEGELAGFADCLALIDRVRRRAIPEPLAAWSETENRRGSPTELETPLSNDAAPTQTISQPKFSEHSDSADVSPPVPLTHTSPGPGEKRSMPLGTDRIGRFQVLRELGRGGVGVVVLAFDPNLRRQVALKVPLPYVLSSDRLNDRFLREGEAAARLHHPAIVAVHEVGQDGPIAFIVSEYCPGTTLSKWLAARPGPVPPRIAAETVLRLAEAVAHAHAQGVLHRDIKPGNVLVLQSDAQETSEVPEVKLTDFGLAKLVDDDDDTTRTGDLIGTPAYMSPEQAAGRMRDVDVMTDVYALGAVLFELLSGRPPFEGQSRSEIVQKVVSDEPPRIERLRPDVPRDLAVIVSKCLSKTKRERYATAHELAEDLQAYLDGKVIRAKPASALERLLKWIRRRPAVALLAALSVLFPLTVIGILTWSLVRLTDANEEARRQRDIAIERQRESRRREYVSQMRHASELISNEQTEDVLKTLARFEPQEGEEDVRGFVWRHFHFEATKNRPAEWQCHNGSIYSLDFSPDGELLATASTGGMATLWDWRTRTRRLDLNGHDGDVNVAIFSPDASKIATCGDDGTVRIWDARTGQPVHTLRRHEGEVGTLAFHPSGNTLVSGGHDGRICVWDAEGGKLVAEKDKRLGHILALAYSREGDVLLAATRGKRLTAWSSQLNDVIWQHTPEDGQRFEAYAIAVEPTGRDFITGGGDGILQVFEVTTGRSPGPRLVAANRISSLECLANGRNIAVADASGRVAIWDTEGRREAARLQTGRERIWSVVEHPRTHEVAWSNDKGTVFVAPPSKSSGFSTLAQLDGRLRRIKSSRDGKRIFAASADELGVFDVHQRRFLHKTTEVDGIQSMDVSPDDKHIVVAERKGRVRVFEIATFKFIQELPNPVMEALGNPEERHALAFLGDDSRIALPAGSDASRLAVWNIDTMQLEGSIDLEGGKIISLAYSGDDLLAVGTAAEVTLLQCRNGMIDRICSLKDVSPSSLSVQREGKLLVGSGGGTADTLAPPDLSRRGWPETLLSDSVYDIVAGPHGDWYAAVGRGIAIVDPDSLRVRKRLALPEHVARVHSACAGSDSGSLFLGCRDGEILHVDVAYHDADESILARSNSSWMDVTPAGDEVICGLEGGQWSIIDASSAVAGRFDSTEHYTVATPLFEPSEVALAGEKEILHCRRDDLGVIQRIPWTHSHVRRLIPLSDNRLAVEGEEETLHVLDLRTGDVEMPFGESKGHIKALETSFDGTLIAISRTDRSLFVWRVASGEPPRSFGDGSCGYESLAFFPDGRTLIGGGDHGVIHTWDLASGESSRGEIELPVHRVVRGLAVSSDGSAVAVADRTDIVRVLDWYTGEWVCELAHDDSGAEIDHIKFSSTGAFLAVGGTRGAHGFIRFFRTR